MRDSLLMAARFGRRNTTVQVLVYWDFETFCPELEMRGPDSVQEATARELEQNSPNPTVGA